MENNETTPCTGVEIDFTKLKQVPENSIEAKLFQIIDDIDTASDIFKPVMEAYERYICFRVKIAHTHIVSDGYKLYYANDK